MEHVPPKEVWKLQPPRAKWARDAGGQQAHRRGQNSQAIALNQLNPGNGSAYPLGPIMKVKNFRISIVFASSVSVLWALVYVPEGMPIGTLNTATVAQTLLHLYTNRSNS